MPAAGVSGVTFWLWSVLFWVNGGGAQNTEAFSGAEYTHFCAILTARTLPVVWVCAIKIKLGLFVFTLNIFFDCTGVYLYYLYLISSSLFPANPLISVVYFTFEEHTFTSHKRFVNPIFAEYV